MVTDDNGYITYEPPAESENGDGSRNCQAIAVNKRCTPSLCEEVRERLGKAREGVGERSGKAREGVGERSGKAREG